MAFDLGLECKKYVVFLGFWGLVACSPDGEPTVLRPKASAIAADANVKSTPKSDSTKQENKAAEVQPIANKKVKAGETFTIAVAATDSEHDALEYRFSTTGNVLQAQSNSMGLFRIEVPASAKSATVAALIEVRDESEHITKVPFVIQIQAAPPPTLIQKGIGMACKSAGDALASAACEAAQSIFH